jgi:hypothetical protein
MHPSQLGRAPVPVTKNRVLLPSQSHISLYPY